MKITFQPLTHPMEVNPPGMDRLNDDEQEHFRITHWASCPTNGEPIMYGGWELLHPDEDDPGDEKGTK